MDLSEQIIAQSDSIVNALNIFPIHTGESTFREATLLDKRIRHDQERTVSVVSFSVCEERLFKILLKEFSVLKEGSGEISGMKCSSAVTRSARKVDPPPVSTDPFNLTRDSDLCVCHYPLEVSDAPTPLSQGSLFFSSCSSSRVLYF
jgi:hypothetical protein